MTSPIPHAAAPLAFGFANSLLLWGSLAASLPIIIHLLNRRKFQETTWAAMRFLMAAVRKNRRRVQLEQWLLLAVRTLVILLAALAMARPFLESAGLPLVAGQRTHHVVVIDASLSMAYRPAESNRFEIAKRQAVELVRAARRGDAVSLVLMADPPRVVVGDPSPQLDEVVREIENLAGAHTRADVPATFEVVERVLASSEIPRKSVAVYTDLQAANWRSGAADDALKANIAKLEARKARSILVDVGKDNAENRSIVDMELNTRVVTVNTPFTVRVVARNHGPSVVRDARVRFLVDGQIVNERVLEEWPVGEDAPLAFTHTLVSPGDHVLEAMIEDDPLDVDNRRRLVVAARESLRVLLVDGDARSGGFESETDYLAEAVNPETESNDPVSAIRPEIVNESQFSARDLAPYDAVVLCNVAQFTERETAVLDAYLRLGGGLVLFTGDQVLVENYNRVLHDEGRGLLPVEIVGVAGDPGARNESVAFDPLEFRHPLVASFAGASDAVVAGLTGVRTWRRHQLRVPEGSPARVALAFTSGEPAVVEAPRGRGRVYVVATSADAQWTNWPLHPSYPPVMEQLVLLAASSRFEARNVEVGEPLDMSLPARAEGLEARVARPDSESASVRVAADADVGVFRYDATELAGVYDMRLGPPVPVEARFAVNPDPIESDTAKLDEAALRQLLPDWDFVYVGQSSGGAAEAAAAASRRGELHRPLLWGVLVLLLLETVLAWKFGHHA